MPSIRQRIRSLESQASATFAGFVVISSWEYECKTGTQALAQYIAANGPVPDNKQAVLIGWSA